MLSRQRKALIQANQSLTTSISLSPTIVYTNAEVSFHVLCLLKNISVADGNELFSLFQNNMKTLYESTEIWNSEDKRKYLLTEDSYFIILRINTEIIGFAMFKLEWDDLDDPSVPVVYLYELQIQESSRGKQLGIQAIQLIERLVLQHTTVIKKMMLTCFKINTSAMRFYLRNGFVIDEDSPSKQGHLTENYEILSKPLNIAASS